MLQAKAASYRGKFSKYVVVANSKLGDKFLEEVSTTFQSFLCKMFMISFHIVTSEILIQITKHWSSNLKPEM
jgi:hypothetical protein